MKWTGETLRCHREPNVAFSRSELNGWANYFRLGSATRAYRVIDQHVTRRLRQWLCRKHKVQRGKYMRFPDPFLYQQLGLTRLRALRRSSAWANA